jgi:hypothetical protein
MNTSQRQAVRAAMRLAAVLAVMGAVIGCQSEREAWQIVCESIDRPEIRNVEPDLQAVLAARHIADNVSNHSVRRFFEAMPSMDHEERDRVVKEAIARVGIERCPLLLSP